MSGSDANVPMVTFNASLFDRAADLYDESPPFFQQQGRMLVEFTHLPVGAQVLDVGSGKGAVVLPALDAVGLTGTVTAVDVSEEMVRHLRGYGLPGLSVHQADVAALPLADGSCDHATSGFTFHILSDTAGAFREVARVLRPGGTLCWSMPGTHPDANEWQQAYGEIYARFSSRLPQMPTEMSPEHDLDAAITNAGFEVLEQTSNAVSIPVGDAEGYWAWTQSHGVRWLTDALDTKGAAELKAAVISSLVEQHPTQGRDIMVAPTFFRLAKVE